MVNWFLSTHIKAEGDEEMRNKLYVQPSVELSALVTEDVITASGESTWSFEQIGAGIEDVNVDDFDTTFDFRW